MANLYLGRTLGGDALFYPMIAEGFLRGEGLRIYEPYIGDTVRALYPPVYPLLLASWGAVAGLSTTSLAMMNLVIDGGTGWMILHLGGRIGRPDAGRAAAWLYLVWPSVLLSSPVAQKEGLIAILVVALATAWLDLRREIGMRTIVTTGVLSGLLALTQPALAPRSGLFGICLFAREPRRLARSAVPAALVAGLVMLPWWIRNWTIFHAFVPLTSSGQVSLWIGNNPTATGNWVPTPPALRGMPELDYARAAGAMARAWIVQHPADFVQLTLEKFLRATGTAQAEIARLSQARPAPSAGVVGMLFPASQAGHLLLLGSSAAMLLIRRRRLPNGLGPLLLACGAQLIFFNVWFEFGERHREFMIPLLLLLIVPGVVSRS